MGVAHVLCAAAEGWGEVGLLMGELESGLARPAYAVREAAHV